MTFKELVEEVINRGFENIANEEGGEARIKRWINQTYREIVDHRAWGFLEEEKEGNAPLTIADLSHVLSVVNVTSDAPVTFTTRAALTDWDPALSTTGVASQWYLVGEDELHVYPADVDSTIRVYYLKDPPDLKADADVPVVPEDYHGVIEDGAVLRAYKTTDNYEAIAASRSEFNNGLRSMRKRLRKSYKGNRLVRKTGTVNDYIG